MTNVTVTSKWTAWSNIFLSNIFFFMSDLLLLMLSEHKFYNRKLHQVNQNEGNSQRKVLRF